MSSHRADRRSRRAPSGPGVSPSARPGRQAGTRVQGRPDRRERPWRPLSTRALAGATALTLGAVGAVTLTASQAEPSAHLLRARPPAYVADGAAVLDRGTALAGRERAVSRSAERRARTSAVSRDSRRRASELAATERLRAAAEKRSRERDAALATLAAGAHEQARRIAQNAWQLPVTPGAYHLTSRFGECSGLWSHCHTGLDFAAPSGTPIHAVANGAITETASAGAYGNRTIETLGDGTQIWYCHQTAFAVQPGERVDAGQVIGSVGSTGNTTGPHVHLEVRPDSGTAGGSHPTAARFGAEAVSGDPVDPYAALVAHGLKP